jgi:glutamate racemase
MSSSPIGIFDSGVGGLSILREIVAILPGEDLIYFADQAHVPYGRRQLSEVRRLSEEIVRFLLAQGAKLIVVACNTASAAALHTLRQSFPEVPFVGMEPAVKPAAQVTQTKIVGVLATPATFQGELFESVQSRFAQGVQLVEITLLGLVERIELGDLNGETTVKLLEDALTPLIQENIDTIVLACTHYPFVIPVIREIVGSEVEIIDPSPAIAKQVGRLLSLHGLQNLDKQNGQVRFFTTSETGAFNSVSSRLLSREISATLAAWQGEAQSKILTNSALL